jgi:hypothetical protein
MAITWPSNTKVVIDSIRNAIGRDVIFHTVHRDDCPACNINPVTNESTNPFCTTCSGIGWIITYSGTVMKAHVTWNPSETLQWNEGGMWKNYKCRIQVEYTLDNKNVVEGADNVEVDGIKLRIANKTFAGVASLNRIVMGLKEE